MKKILLFLMMFLPMIVLGQETSGDTAAKDSLVSVSLNTQTGQVTIVHTTQFDAVTNYKYILKWLASRPEENNCKIKLQDEESYQINASEKRIYFEKVVCLNVQETRSGTKSFTMTFVCKDNKFKAVFDGFTYDYKNRNKFGTDFVKDRPYLFEASGLNDKEAYEEAHKQSNIDYVTSIVLFMNKQKALEDF